MDFSLLKEKISLKMGHKLGSLQHLLERMKYTGSPICNVRHEQQSLFKHRYMNTTAELHHCSVTSSLGRKIVGL